MNDSVRVSVFKRTGRKFYYAQYRDPVTGDKVVRSTGTTIRRDAERFAVRWERELQEGRSGRSCRMSWKAFTERYFDEVVPGFKPTFQDKVHYVVLGYERMLKPKLLRDVTGEAPSRYQLLQRQRGLKDETIKGYFAVISPMMKWAKQQKLISWVPAMPKQPRAKGQMMMRGRPISTEEFERMLVATPRIVGEMAAPSWLWMLNGLWWSGLRLAESLDLHWTDTSRLCVDFTSRHPMFRIPAEHEKGNKDRLLPMAPEFVELLEQVPSDRRRGFVFDPRPKKKLVEGRISRDLISRTIAEIGRRANVVVRDLDDGAVKYASAHDLRRSFGDRWSYRVLPRVLKELMRHESIATTERYYLGHNAQATAAIMWEKYRQESSSPNVASATLGDTSAIEP